MNEQNFNSSKRRIDDDINRRFHLVKKRKTIEDAYTTPGHPAAFSSPSNIVRYFKKKGKNLKTSDVKKVLRSIEAYTLHKESKRIRVRNPFFVYWKRQQAQFDLADMKMFARVNDNITFLLTVIDVFTKKLFVRPLLNKSAAHTRKAIASVLDEMKANDKYGQLQQAFMDRGTEFRNKQVENLFRKRNVKFFYSTSDLKASVVERVIGSLKKLIYGDMERRSNHRYIHNLEQLVATYNNRGHRTLKYLTPNEAELNVNQNHVFNIHNERYKKFIMKRRKPKFKVGDRVLTKIQGMKGKLDPYFTTTPKVIIHTQHPTVRDEITKIEARVHVSDVRPPFLP